MSLSWTKMAAVVLSYDNVSYIWEWVCDVNRVQWRWETGVSTCIQSTIVLTHISGGGRWFRLTISWHVPVWSCFPTSSFTAFVIHIQVLPHLCLVWAPVHISMQSACRWLYVVNLAEDCHIFLPGLQLPYHAQSITAVCPVLTRYYILHCYKTVRYALLRCDTGFRICITT